MREPSWNTLKKNGGKDGELLKFGNENVPLSTCDEINAKLVAETRILTLKIKTPFNELKSRTALTPLSHNLWNKKNSK